MIWLEGDPGGSCPPMRRTENSNERLSSATLGFSLASPHYEVGPWEECLRLRTQRLVVGQAASAAASPAECNLRFRLPLAVKPGAKWSLTLAMLTLAFDSYGWFPSGQ